MADSQPHCSLDYHRFGPTKLETFAHGVSTGIYTHVPPFGSPPIATKILFDGVIDVYHDAYEAYKNGGKSQKGDYLAARENLISQLDSTAEFVDEIVGVDETMIILAGYTPTKTGDSKSVIPEVPSGIVLTRGISGELFAECRSITGASFLGCIMVAGKPLPDGFGISNAGQIIVSQDNPNPNVMPLSQSGITVIIDLTKKRKKHFTGLTKGVEYYFYFYAGNSAGVSQLSEVKSLMCG